MQGTWYPLLALMAQSLGHRAALAHGLDSEAALDRLCRDPSFVPSAAAWHEAARALTVMRALDIALVPRWSLPERLRAAKPGVPALFVRGDVSLLGAPAAGIVGARRASSGPLAWAAQWARALAQMGIVLVSGGARGIDAAAHRAAIDAGGRTVAYLGVAADRIYPAANRRLFERLLSCGGALVSEYPPLEPTFAYGHANRNRFIAAHAEHLLVAEASLTSGTLGTAEYAVRRGVPVWVPEPAQGGERGGISRLVERGEARILSSLDQLQIERQPGYESERARLTQW